MGILRKKLAKSLAAGVLGELQGRSEVAYLIFAGRLFAKQVILICRYVQYLHSCCTSIPAASCGTYTFIRSFAGQLDPQAQHGRCLHFRSCKAVASSRRSSSFAGGTSTPCAARSSPLLRWRKNRPCFIYLANPFLLPQRKVAPTRRLDVQVDELSNSMKECLRQRGSCLAQGERQSRIFVSCER